MSSVLKEVLPKAGLVYSEKGSLSEILCKPKLMPIKSATLVQLENRERELMAQAQAQQAPPQSAPATAFGGQIPPRP